MHIKIPKPLACETTFLIGIGLLSNCPACYGHLVKILITLEHYGLFGSSCFFNIVQPPVMQNGVEGLPSIILARQGILVKMLITLESHGIF